MGCCWRGCRRRWEFRNGEHGDRDRWRREWDRRDSGDREKRQREGEDESGG